MLPKLSPGARGHSVLPRPTPPSDAAEMNATQRLRGAGASCTKQLRLGSTSPATGAWGLGAVDGELPE